MPADRSLIGTLQIGRALAAFAVVLHHGTIAGIAFVGPVPEFVRVTGEAGALGVDFFFVLSGFIIYWVHGADSRNIDSIKTYARNRLTRIYLPYLPVSVAIIVAYTMLPGLALGARDWGLFTSLTLLPSGRPPALSVAWTLIHEVLFYGIFAVGYYTGYLWRVMAAWSACILIFARIGNADLLDIAFLGPLLARLAAPINLEFLFGMIVAELAPKLPIRFWRVLVLVGITGIVLFVAWSVPFAWRPIFGIFAALIVAGLVAGERAKLVAAGRIGLFLGGASYAIYLVHNPTISLAIRAVDRLGISSPIAAIIAVCIAGTAAGIGYHLLVERPALAFARKHFDHRSAKKSLASGSGCH